jgi:N6-adenosine-specific RNA methylase IME4
LNISDIGLSCAGLVTPPGITDPRLPTPIVSLPGDTYLIEAPATEHSRKPAVFAELIERWYPNPFPKIELFCRGAPRPGWSAWGHEAVLDKTDG